MQTINLATATHRFLLAIALTVATTFTAFAQGSAIPKVLTDKFKLKSSLSKITLATVDLKLTCTINAKPDIKKYSDHLIAQPNNTQNFNAIVVDYTVLQINSAGNNTVLTSRETSFFKFDFSCTTLQQNDAKLNVATGVLTVDNKNYTLQKIGENTFSASRISGGVTEVLSCTIRRATFYIESGFTFID